MFGCRLTAAALKLWKADCRDLETVSPLEPYFQFLFKGVCEWCLAKDLVAPYF